MALRRLGGAGGMILLALVLSGCFLVQASPNPGNDVNILNGVSCPTASSCTAVGYYSNIPNTGNLAFIET